MVRKVVSLSKTDTYRRLKEVLEKNSELRAFPVVSDKESKALVGSVSRKTMQQALDDQIGEEARARAAGAEARREHLRKLRTKSMVPGKRDGAVQDRHSSECVCANGRSGGCEGHRNYGLSLESEEVGRDRSHTAPHLAPSPSPHHGKILTVGTHKKVHYAVSGMVHQLAQSLHRCSSKSQVHSVDFTDEKERQWMERQLDRALDFSLVEVDEAPFQLVETASLYKVHSLFSLLGVQRAYVTAHGALVGVVSLREIRKGIETVQNGNVSLLPRHVEHSVPVPNIIEDAAEDPDTDDEDVISPRAVLEESPETSVRVRRNLLGVRTPSGTVCCSDDCECGQSSSSCRDSSATGGQPLVNSLHTYLGDTRRANDRQRAPDQDLELDGQSVPSSLRMQSTVPGVISDEVVWSPRCSRRNNGNL